jgi:methanogenic corrinoid protein MtbC1
MIDNERQLVEAIAEMREEEAFALAKAMLDRGEDPVRVLELCREAMDIVGKRFEKQ